LRSAASGCMRSSPYRWRQYPPCTRTTTGTGPVAGAVGGHSSANWSTPGPYHNVRKLDTLSRPAGGRARRRRRGRAGSRGRRRRYGRTELAQPVAQVPGVVREPGPALVALGRPRDGEPGQRRTDDRRRGGGGEQERARVGAQVVDDVGGSRDEAAAGDEGLG